MIVTIIKFALPAPMTQIEARRRFRATFGSYEGMPGLIYKQYIRGLDGLTSGAIYTWESEDAAKACFDRTWHQRLAEKFGGPPTISWLDCVGVVDNRHHESFGDEATPLIDKD